MSRKIELADYEALLHYDDSPDNDRFKLVGYPFGNVIHDTDNCGYPYVWDKDENGEFNWRTRKSFLAKLKREAKKPLRMERPEFSLDELELAEKVMNNEAG